MLTSYVSQLGKNLMVDTKTVSRYLDLLVDLLLVRRMLLWHSNVGKRLVKSPKVYIRDSDLVHALLGIDDFDTFLGIRWWVTVGRVFAWKTC
jgi:hypothetical protein